MHYGGHYTSSTNLRGIIVSQQQQSHIQNTLEIGRISSIHLVLQAWAWCKRGPTLPPSHKEVQDYGQLVWQCQHLDASSRPRHSILTKPSWLEVALKSNMSWCLWESVAPLFPWCQLVRWTFESSLDYEKNKNTSFAKHLQFSPQCPS